MRPPRLAACHRLVSVAPWVCQSGNAGMSLRHTQTSIDCLSWEIIGRHGLGCERAGGWFEYVESMEHPSSDQLEQYAMQALVESDSSLLEEHLLLCPECRSQLRAEMDFVTAMRSAAAMIRSQK